MLMYHVTQSLFIIYMGIRNKNELHCKDLLHYSLSRLSICTMIVSSCNCLKSLFSFIIYLERGIDMVLRGFVFYLLNFVLDLIQSFLAMAQLLHFSNRNIYSMTFYVESTTVVFFYWSS